jgi:CDP-glucose 4,6-dehydratase
MEALKDFYKDKKILITGSSGFVGSWLSLTLKELDVDVYGISLKTNTVPSLFNIFQMDDHIDQSYVDINDRKKLFDTIEAISPDIVFHLAAQPLVMESYKAPYETFNTNVIGTLNVLEACDALNKDINFICITTDKCYENKENGNRFVESDPIGGKDPYSASKACTEILTKSYALSFKEKSNMKICSARAGNIIGGGDWAKDRIVTDIILAISKGEDITLRSPKAIRPWQHVIDVVYGYLKLGQYNSNNNKSFESFNFGPLKENEINVEVLTQMFITNWNSNTKILINDSDSLPESNLLRLDSSKAYQMLDWQPIMNIEQTIMETASWYKRYYTEKNVKNFTLEQIKKYLKL